MFASCNSASSLSRKPSHNLNHLEHKLDDQDIASARCDVLANFNLMINYPNEVLHEKVMYLLNYLVEFVAAQLNDSAVMIQEEKLAQVKIYYEDLSKHILFDNYSVDAFTLADFNHMISMVQIQSSFFRNNTFPKGLLTLLNILPKHDLHIHFSDESLQILQLHGIDTSRHPSVSDKLNDMVGKFLRAKRLPPLPLLHLTTNSQLEYLQLELGIRPINPLKGCCADFIFNVLNEHFKNHDGINKDNFPVEILFNLAVCYRDGIGVDVNNEEAMKLFRDCASFGYKPAMSVLMIGPVKNFIDNKSRTEDKIIRLEEAFILDNLNVDACMLLSRYYLKLVLHSINNESSKDNNFAEIMKINAKKKYEELAFFGNHRAAFEYADMLERGSIFPQDIKLAMDYYECAAILGNSDAAFKLGCIYSQNKDRAKSIFWYKKAMNLGSEHATIKLFKKYCRDFDKTGARGIFLIAKNDFKEIIKSLMKITRLDTHGYEINVLLLKFIRKHPELKKFIRRCEIESYAYKLKEVPLKIRQSQELISAKYVVDNDLETKESSLDIALNQRFLVENIFDDSLVFILRSNANFPAHLISFETVERILVASNDDYGDKFRNPHTGEIMSFMVLRNLF